MAEVRIKTHLIVTDIRHDYRVKWCGNMKDAKPVWENGLPIFILKSRTRRAELNTLDMALIEKIGKDMAEPTGRQAITTAKTYIYLKEVDNNERLMGVITHQKIKTFAPMFDKVGWR